MMSGIGFMGAGTRAGSQGKALGLKRCEETDVRYGLCVRWHQVYLLEIHARSEVGKQPGRPASRLGR